MPLKYKNVWCHFILSYTQWMSGIKSRVQVDIVTVPNGFILKGFYSERLLFRGSLFWKARFQYSKFQNNDLYEYQLSGIKTFWNNDCLEKRPFGIMTFRIKKKIFKVMTHRNQNFRIFWWSFGIKPFHTMCFNRLLCRKNDSSEWKLFKIKTFQYKSCSEYYSVLLKYTLSLTCSSGRLPSSSRTWNSSPSA